VKAKKNKEEKEERGRGEGVSKGESRRGAEKTFRQCIAITLRRMHGVT